MLIIGSRSFQPDPLMVMLILVALELGPPRDLESSRLSWAGGGVVGALGMLALTLALGV